MNVATLPRDLDLSSPLGLFPLKKKKPGRGNDASQTLFLLFECITSETKESCVSRTDALLVGTGDQVMEVNMSIADLGPLENSRTHA